MTEFRDAPLFINNEFCDPQSGAWSPALDPGTEQQVGRMALCDGRDVARAIEAGEAAQPAWARLSAQERGVHLRAVSTRIRARAQEIVALEALDAGNTIARLARDVEIVCESLDYYAGLTLEIKGETVPASARNLHMTLREPYGVVGRIAPFNHPFMFAGARMAAPLAAGNAIVIKPPETSALSSRLLGEACADVLPPGLVSITPGNGGEAGDALVRDPRVKRISFTGSAATGLAIQRAAAERSVKHISLELGGKNPLLVLADADPDEVARAAVAGMNFSWAGQSCGSTSRLLLPDSLHDDVLARVLDLVSQIRIGPATDPASQMGPLNNARHYERVLAHVDGARRGGARLCAGGERPGGEAFKRGYWLAPTVFADVTPDMSIAREEVFGPVLSVMRWRRLDEAIAIANATEYGLTAAIWGNDVKTAFRVAKEVRAGYVWINGGSAHFLGTPFSGMKNSGVGSEESVDELLSYTERKSIHVML
jgi:betaine-aldehyde dehydrogenase